MKRQNGYTIIEVLVAVIILALVLPGLATMVIASRKAQVGNERFESAASIGQSVLDSLTLLPPGNIPLDGVIERENNGTKYSISWTSAIDAKNTNTISMNVKWKVGNKEHACLLQGIGASP